MDVRRIVYKGSFDSLTFKRGYILMHIQKSVSLAYFLTHVFISCNQMPLNIFAHLRHYWQISFLCDITNTDYCYFQHTHLSHPFFVLLYHSFPEQQSVFLYEYNMYIC